MGKKKGKKQSQTPSESSGASQESKRQQTPQSGQQERSTHQPTQPERAPPPPNVSGGPSQQPRKWGKQQAPPQQMQQQQHQPTAQNGGPSQQPRTWGQQQAPPPQVQQQQHQPTTQYGGPSQQPTPWRQQQVPPPLMQQQQHQPTTQYGGPQQQPIPRSQHQAPPQVQQQDQLTAQYEGPQQQPIPRSQQQAPPPQVQQQQHQQTTQYEGSPVSSQPLAPQMQDQSSSHTADIESLQRQLQSFTLKDRRQSNPRDRKGRPIKVYTNHFPLDLKNITPVAYHYDVSLEPDRPKYLYRSVVNEFIRQCFPNCYPSYDGKKNLISARLLPNVGDGSFTSDVEVENHESMKMKAFKVTIKLVNKIDMTVLNTYLGANVRDKFQYTQLAVQFLDIILRHSPANNRVQCGRSFFSGRVISLGDCYDLWFGHFQSAVLGWKTYLNVDVAHKGFPEPCHVLDVINNLCRSDLKRPMSGGAITTLEKHVKNLKISYEIPRIPNSKRVYRVNGVSKSSANDSEFTLDSGTQTTVTKYFASEKRYKVQYGHLPCLWVGSKQKHILLPVELCQIVGGQVTNRQLNPEQTAAMVKSAATNTAIRKEKIYKAFRESDFNRNPNVAEFGISVSGEFEMIEGRILDPPKLEYEKGKQVNPRDGVWRGDRFMVPVQLKSWCTVDLARCYDDEIGEFEKLVVDRSRYIGIGINAPSYPVAHDTPNEKNVERLFTERRTCDVIFCLIPTSGPTYGMIKRIAERNIGVLTQCITVNTIRKIKRDPVKNISTVDNILLKVNAKRNGINHTLLKTCRPKCLDKPCMIIGADVTHPSPDQKNIPSIASVTASHDPTALFKYNIISKLQDPKDEMIRDLREIVVQQLKFFFRNSRQKPGHIIVFRDGVSDSQIKQVLHVELKAIRMACKDVQKEGYEPPITFIIVQKRHHTRLFPTDPRDSRDRNCNVPAGTCVDRTITHPTATDFYLVSHASIQGTARPTKYRLVWDDANMSEEEIETLAYYLCHLFSRCNRSVSYPAPTYYAHLAAFRARAYIEGKQINLENLSKEQQYIDIKNDFAERLPMFFV